MKKLIATTALIALLTAGAGLAQAQTTAPDAMSGPATTASTNGSTMQKSPTTQHVTKKSKHVKKVKKTTGSVTPAPVTAPAQ